MEAYCYICKQEREIAGVRISYNNRRGTEKKTRGYCIKCEEPICLVEVLED